MSSLRSSAIPLTAAYVSNACRGMSGDSLRQVEYHGGTQGRENATWFASKQELLGTSFLWAYAPASLGEVRSEG